MLRSSVGLVLALACVGWADEKKWALVVGINEYNHPELNDPRPLQFAEADASELAEVLRASGYQVIALLGKQATKQAIQKELDAFTERNEQADVLIVAFAGHGIQPETGRDAYFCPYDARQKAGGGKADWLAESLVSYMDVLNHLKAAPAKSRALFADACRNDPNAGRGRGVGTKLQVNDLPSNTIMLLSCSEGQKAWEDARWKHGAFFYHVLAGLKGSAKEEDNTITGDSLYKYVNRRVPSEVATVIGGGAEQKPFRLTIGDVDFRVAPKGNRFSGGSPGDIRFDTNAQMKLVWCPPGKLRYVRKAITCIRTQTVSSGVPEGRFRIPYVANVNFNDGFWLSETRVSNALYKNVASKPGDYKEGGPDDYEVCVTWQNASEYCRKLTEIGHRNGSLNTNEFYDLPTSAHWQYALRAETSTTYFWGNDPSRYEMFCNDYSDQRLKSVKSNPWNVYGLLNKRGEWCRDWVNFDAGPSDTNDLMPPQAKFEYHDHAIQAKILTTGSSFTENSPATEISSKNELNLEELRAKVDRPNDGTLFECGTLGCPFYTIRVGKFRISSK